MVVRILVLSDTHLNRLTPGLPDVVKREISSADLVIHAGDFTDVDVYQELNSLKRITAVCGNMDVPELQVLLPEKLITTIDGVKIGVIHGSGSPSSVLHRARSAFDNVDIIIFGHSHAPINKVIDKVQVLNPGSPTVPRQMHFPSYGIIEIEKEKFNSEVISISTSS